MHIHSYIYIPFFMLLSIIGNAQSQSPKEIFELGNIAYNKKDYTLAVQEYTKIENEGFESVALYRNLGNAYFRQGRYAKARLYYERALRITPTNVEILHNLEVTHTRIVDQFETLPDFFLWRWTKHFAFLLPYTLWGIGIIIFWAIFLFFTSQYLIAKTYTKKKIYFRLSFIFLFLGALSFGSAWIYKDLQHKEEGIVMSVKASVKTAPDAESKIKFIIHEGCKISIEDQINSYYKIRISDGNIGWIADNEFEKI